MNNWDVEIANHIWFIIVTVNFKMVETITNHQLIKYVGIKWGQGFEKRRNTVGKFYNSYESMIHELEGIMIISIKTNNQGPDFDDMPSFLPCEIDDAMQYINLGYGAQAPKIVIL